MMGNGRDIDNGRSNVDREESELYLNYAMMEKIGEGTYGTVYKATDKRDGRRVAIKKIRIEHEEEGVPSTAIREISLLKECEHPNVVSLLEVCSSTNALHLVFECLDMDVRMYLKKHGAFKGNDLKNSTFQCFKAIEFCHEHRILHRDLKPQNVLIDCSSKCLKLADFGLARAFQIPLRAYTHEVVTLWYRAPEILLGQAKYATPMDIWSLGCIATEMATAQALFPGDSEIDTIFKIFQKLGTPTDEVWPGVSSLRDYKDKFPQWPDTELKEVKEKTPSLGANGVAFIRLCLKYNPVARPSARKALQHAFFEGVDPEIRMMDQAQR